MASALMARQTWPPQGGLSQPLLQPWMHLIPLAVLYGEGTSFSASRIYFLVAPRRGESCEIHCRQPQGGGRQLRMLQLVETGPGAHLLSAVAKGQCVQGQKPASIWGCGPCGHQPQETPRDVLWALPGLHLLSGCGVWRGQGPGGLWGGEEHAAGGAGGESWAWKRTARRHPFLSSYPRVSPSQWASRGAGAAAGEGEHGVTRQSKAR